MSDRPNQPDPAPETARREDAVAVVRRLRDAGHIAYFAGGCVRDMLLGLEPKDYDIATDAPPDRVRQLFPNTQAVGAAFGVILVRQHKSIIEVATFRSDGKYTDGRRPEDIVFTTAEEDAKRRDFTINGMFYDPIEAKVIDFVGGQEDLKNKVLRAIGEPNHRFEEDHLRLLRAIRFAARFYLSIDPATGAAIVKHAPHLVRISPERIAEELRLMLSPATRCDAWVRMGQVRLLPVIFRHWPTREMKDDGGKRCGVLCKLGDEAAGLGLILAAAMIARWPTSDDEDHIRRCFQPRDVGDAVNAMRKSLKISNDESDEMSGTLLGITQLLEPAQATLAQKKRFLARPSATSSRRLMRGLESQGYFSSRVRQLEEELTALASGDFAPPPFITGDDLTAAGFRPGPLFKRVLDAVYDAQLENRVRNQEEAMALAKNLAAGQSA